ncbi:ABC transporter ATP-binding protein [Hespellia stercorisuis]|uniref:ATP-binding cassette, subfamily B n=1 Tax=Hespellia stercorisuis DSM 15480 TaxID=1121950 RepID=A0A1M6QC57_9FIRM|nr:ABC transporter ATP-binding protein [Hespellia stercorisuis]SHK17869.1 ATP-binding cassette, subfamily B [Hespellia stercorisuis DSM 15480]
MLKTLMGEVKEYKRDSILSPIFVIMEVIMEIIIPILMASIIDNGVEKSNISHVWTMGALMVAIAMISMFCGVMSGKYAARASSGFAKNLRKAMYENIQTFSFANIDKYSTPGLVTRLTTDVTNVQNAYQMIIRMCARSPFMLIFAMTMTFVVNRKLAMIFLVATIFLAIVLALIIAHTFPVFSMVFKKYDALNASVQENVSAIRVVKAYVREDYEVNKFHTASNNLYKLFVQAEKLLTLNMPVMQFTVYSCILLLSWLGAKMIVAGSLQTGELVSLFAYVMNVLVSLMMMSMAFVMIAMSKASADRIAEVINEKASLVNGENPVYEVPDGSILFDHVNFAYQKDSENKVLNEINCEIKAGETIGIIGGTGSAKTSFVQLIPRLYDVTGGCVKVGGIDVREYDIETLRDQVAMVLQNNVLFSGTINDNMRWGKKDATQEEIIRACRLSQADEFVQTLPDKYETYIEQGGTNVSGGQKQRLCIARALIKKPKILILDDSTSAVDTRTDSLIRQAFATEIPDTTKLIIAQRITSVQDADRIIVMNDGMIDAIGTHEELLTDNMIYRDVYESQVKGAAENE